VITLEKQNNLACVWFHIGGESKVIPDT